jgi:Rrf2 family transcriptional regulator, iron-sulfur cluster assembly transcription factor
MTNTGEQVKANLLSRRCMLAITAVVDIALHAGPALVGARPIAARHNLPPRHLETLLQALVRAKILKGLRGPHGGYELARKPRRITVGEIVRMVVSADNPDKIEASSTLVRKVIEPRVRRAIDGFLANLDAITIEDLHTAAIVARVLEAEAPNEQAADPLGVVNDE